MGVFTFLNCSDTKPRQASHINVHNLKHSQNDLNELWKQELNAFSWFLSKTRDIINIIIIISNLFYVDKSLKFYY